MRTRKIFATAIAAAVVGLVAMPPAGATTQIIDGTIGSSISVDAPSETVNWTLSPTGANTTSGGTIGITSNVAYTVSVAANKSAMTKYEVAEGTYDDTVQLGTGLSLIPTLASGVGVPVASLIVGTTPALLATSTGLTTDSYDLALSQVTSVGDRALGDGYTYRIVLTFTAASTL